MGLVDALAVTQGPRLIGSLLVGVETARTWSWYWDKPLIPVNHLVAHLYGNWLSGEGDVEFPALALIVSGGHTELILLKDHGVFQYLGGTLDDAAGEAFDKVARVLDLGYPGGPAISREAEKYQGEDMDFLPRPLLHSKNFDFSFSGLKTATMREVSRRKGSALSLTAEQVSCLAHEFEEAATDVLTQKAVKAALATGAKSLLLAGGVAANKRLRVKIGEYAGNVKVIVPPIRFCTDNGAVIASAAFFNYHPRPWQEISADPSWEIA